MLSLHHKERTTCHASFLWEICNQHPDLVTFIEAPEIRTGDGARSPVGEPHAVEVVARAAMSDVVRSWSDERAALRAGMEVAGFVSPSRIAGDVLGDELDERAADELAEDDVDPSAAFDDHAPGRGRRGRAGTAVGRAVHGVLQVVDLGDPVDLDVLADAQARAEGVDDRADVVRRLARSAIDSATVRDAVAVGRFWRELFVAAPVGGRLVEGYIDLLYENADGELVVVDYKTDQARSDDELDASMAHYRSQGAAYSAVVAAALGRPVARCVFVFVRSTGAVEREITDLDAAVAEVVSRLGASG